jgi:hypothetical protein
MGRRVVSCHNEEVYFNAINWQKDSEFMES